MINVGIVVLDIEPENQLIKEYQKTLRRYIRKGSMSMTP